jgi:hypothetical protein
MRPLRGLLAVTLLLVASVTGLATEFVPPKQTIQGADKPIPLGELVDLSVSTIDKAPEFYVKSSYTWRVLDYDAAAGKFVAKHVRETDNGIFFGAGVLPKRLYAECVATHLYLVKDKDGKAVEVATKTVFLTAEVTIGEPGPAPGPGPGPTPDPVLPDGKYKLAKFVYRASIKVKSDAVRPKAAAALAASYRGVASAISAGAVKDVKEALTKVTDSNRSALSSVGADKAAWEPVFTALQDQVYDLYTKKQINTPADFAVVFNEIAEGFAAVK